MIFTGTSLADLKSFANGVQDEAGHALRIAQSAVYVLHAFQKKSTRGIAMGQRDIDLIKQRLRQAQAKENAHG